MSIIYLRPLSWHQEIRHFGEGYLYIWTRCVTTKECDVVLSNGAKLRDYEIDLGIRDGLLKPDDRRKFNLGDEAIGGLKFVEDHNHFHGWFYIGSNYYSALWDQVRTGGYADCTIDLGVDLIRAQNGDVFSIDDASIHFVRKPEERQRKSGSSGAFGGDN